MFFALQYMYGPGSRGLWAPRVDFMSAALLILGIGSFLFHASLRQTLEIVDEFSMLILAWSMLQALLTIRRSPAVARLISNSLALGYTSFAVFYLQSPLIIYQVMAFVFSLFVIIVQTHYLLNWLQPAFPKAKRHEWTWRICRAGFTCVQGYVLWNIDLEHCAQLRAMRARVGLPWAWLFEFHGWWHIMTAIGAAKFMDVVREVRQEAEREQNEHEHKEHEHKEQKVHEEHKEHKEHEE